MLLFYYVVSYRFFDHCSAAGAYNQLNIRVHGHIHHLSTLLYSSGLQLVLECSVQTLMYETIKLLFTHINLAYLVCGFMFLNYCDRLLRNNCFLQHHLATNSGKNFGRRKHWRIDDKLPKFSPLKLRNIKVFNICSFSFVGPLGHSPNMPRPIMLAYC